MPSWLQACGRSPTNYTYEWPPTTPRPDLLRLADAVEKRAKQRDAAFETVERRMEGEDDVLPLGSLAEHRRSLTEEAKRLVEEAQAVEARYKHGIGYGDWEG